MKVLFLDIDGVLNSHRTAVAFGGYPHDFSPEDMTKFDHAAINLICLAVEETGAKIVLSSTWRKLFSVEEVASGLLLPIIDRTPNSMSGHRGQEIASWLSEHPGVKQYCIVDDDSDMNGNQMPYFVKTNHSDGLSFQNYLDIVKILQDRDEDTIA